MGSRKSHGYRPERSEGFEELYRRLEEVVSRLEQGGLSLEESLSLYEEGMKLARRCQELLQEAELRVTRLQEAFAEGLRPVREEAAEYHAEEAASQEEG